LSYLARLKIFKIVIITYFISVIKSGGTSYVEHFKEFF
jgi:hypothetical protein